MATRSYSRSPLRDSVVSGLPTLNAPIAVRVSEEARPETSTGAMTMNWEAPPKKHSPTRSIWPTSPPPPGERASRLCRSRQRAGQYGIASAGWSKDMIAPTPTCTPTATPLQTPTTTPTVTPSREVVGLTAQSASPYTCLSMPSRPVGAVEAGQTTGSPPRCDHSPPAPVFFPRDAPSAAAGSNVDAGQAKRGSTGRKKEVSGIWDLDAPARPLAGQARPAVANCVEADETETRKQVDKMVDDSTGTLRLARLGLGDYRVPFLTLQRLRDAYRSGTGSLRAWTTRASTESGQDEPLEVEKGSLGVLYSSDAFVFHFSIQSTNEEEQFDLAYIWLGRQANIRARAAARNQGRKLLEDLSRSSSQALPPPTPLEVEQGYEPALFLGLFSYMVPPLAAVVHQTRQETPDVRWARARMTYSGWEAVRASPAGMYHLPPGRSLILRGMGSPGFRTPCIIGRELLLYLRCRAFGLQISPRLEGSGIALVVEGGASLLAKHWSLPSRSQVILARVPICSEWAKILSKRPTRVITGMVWMRRLASKGVFEIQESPCLQGSGIALAVEGDTSLLAKHGPLPSRSYVILLRPHLLRVGKLGEEELVGAFDEGYYWHGEGETAAVQAAGVLLCQQGQRMFPPPSVAHCRRRRRKVGPGGKNRPGGGVFGECRMMRGFISDLKIGWPIPEGFWACILPEGSRKSRGSAFGPEDERKLLPQDLRPGCRSRPVRIFTVCDDRRKAGHNFVWEVITGGFPSQMGLSPYMSHVVDAGGSHVYVWNGADSHHDDRRLALRVARSYADRVEGGATVEQADAGYEPIRLLECFPGWEKALLEAPRMPSHSPCRIRTPLAPSTTEASPQLTPTTKTTPYRECLWSIEAVRSGTWGHRGRHHRRSGDSIASSSGSTSTASRLTPPGQRTPPWVLNSPPPLKSLGVNGLSPCDLSRAALFTPPRASVTPPRRLQQLPVRESGQERFYSRTSAVCSNLGGVDAEKNDVNGESLRCPSLSPKGLAATPDSATGSVHSTPKFRCPGLTTPERAPALAESHSGAPVDTEAPMGESRKLFQCTASKELEKTSTAADIRTTKPCDGDAVGSDPIVGRKEPEKKPDIGRGCRLDDSCPTLRRDDQSGDEPSCALRNDGGDYTREAKEGGTEARPWVGLNEDGSWQSEVERRAAGEAGAVEAERRRLAKINGDNSWRAERGTEREGLRGARHVRRESDSLTRLQKGNVRDKLNMFEGVSSSASVKEKQGEDRSSIGALHGRGLVSALNKKLTTDNKPAPPPIVVNSTHEVDGGSACNAGDCRSFSPPPCSANKLEKGGQSPAALRDPEQRRREFVWWKQRSSPSPPTPKSRPSLELIRDGQVRIMSKQLLMACPDGNEREARSKHEATTNQDQPRVPLTPPPRITGRLRWGASSPRWGVSSATTSPTKRNNFWLAKAGLGDKHHGECPASAPATPTSNRKGAWWRGRTVLTPPPPTASVSGKTKGAVGSKEQPQEGSRQANATWVKLRRSRPAKESQN